MRGIIVAALLAGCGGSDDAGLVAAGAGGADAGAAGSGGAIGIAGAGGSVGPDASPLDAAGDASSDAAGDAGGEAEPPGPEPLPEAGDDATPEASVDAAADAANDATGPVLCTIEQRFALCQAAHPGAAAEARQKACACSYQGCPHCNLAGACQPNFCDSKIAAPMGPCLQCLNWFITTYPHICVSCEPFRACLMTSHYC